MKLNGLTLKQQPSLPGDILLEIFSKLAFDTRYTGSTLLYHLNPRLICLTSFR